MSEKHAWSPDGVGPTGILGGGLVRKGTHQEREVARPTITPSAGRESTHDAQVLGMPEVVEAAPARCRARAPDRSASSAAATSRLPSGITPHRVASLSGVGIEQEQPWPAQWVRDSWHVALVFFRGAGCPRSVVEVLLPLAFRLCTGVPAVRLPEGSYIKPPADTTADTGVLRKTRLKRHEHPNTKVAGRGHRDRAGAARSNQWQCH
jgi:hypothetical protein